MSYSKIKSITVPAQETQAGMQTALAAALATALGKSLDSTGTKVLIDGDMGFVFLNSGSANVGISISNENLNHTVQSTKACTSPIIVDYCKFGDNIAVGLRATTGTIMLNCVFAKTENSDPVLLCVQSTNVAMLTVSATAIFDIKIAINVNARAYCFLQKFCPIYIPYMIDGIYSVVGAPSIGTSAVFEANGKHYQLICAAAANTRLAMAID